MMTNKDLDYWCKSEIDEIYSFLETKKDGLSYDEVQKRINQYGLNKIESEEKSSIWSLLLSQFKNWLIITLLISTILAYFLGEKTDAIVILTLIIISVLLGFFQEFKAKKALEKLQKYIVHKTHVIRDGKLQEIESSHLVVGDIVNLDIGDRVPADIRLTKTVRLSSNQTILTGESIPSEKNTLMIDKTNLVPQDAENMVFMGTFISSGSGLGVVVQTGLNTILGKTSELLKKDESSSDFEVETRRFSLFLFRTIIALVVFIFISNSMLGKGVFDSFLFALALAVGVTPELLPAITSVSLSSGALMMGKKSVIVKKLSSVEDLGNMDILCTDKTGTLTRGELSLIKIEDINEKDSDEVLLYGMLSSSNFFDRGERLSRNPIDDAIFQNVKVQKKQNLIDDYHVIDKIKFDYERKRASVLVQKDNKKILISKGSIESILSIGSHVLLDGKENEITPKIHKDLISKFEKYEELGFRAIAIGRSFINKDINTIKEQDITLCGIMLFEDPLKDNVASSIESLKRAGVKIIILSGDGSAIVKKIAIETGVASQDKEVISGEMLTKLTDEEFIKCVENTQLYSRLTPEQKYNIVKKLNDLGGVVGFLGDGINDSPALKAADVGISVDSGAEITKEASDIVLLKKDLGVLTEGIYLGRTTFANITKYILNTISANFGNMSTVALSSLFLKYIPLLPSQILLNNLISDIPMLAISTDSVDKELLSKPKHWDIKLIGRFMIYFGIISSVFDLCLILLMIFWLKVDPIVFRTAWFVESSLSEITITFSIRSKLPFYKSKPSTLLLVLSILSGLLVVIMPWLRFGKSYFSFTSLLPIIWILIALDLIAYFISTEFLKRGFYKRFSGG